MNFKKTTLPNGLRIITVPTKGNPSVTVMVLVETGSNYEKKSENGISHFLEHMMFKGTNKRPSVARLSQELDGLGAHTNAFTSNELTAYHVKAEKKHFKQVLDIVSDIYLDPLLLAPELEKERGVILQEVSMYEDLPQRKVWQVLVKLLYGDNPAGCPVIGSKENIKRFSRNDFINYRKRHYVAQKMVVLVVGDIKEKRAVMEVKKAFKDISHSKKVTKFKVREFQKTPAISLLKKRTDQTHMIFAFRAFNAKNKKIPTLDVLTSVLGRGMSSRLWQKMREELGVCYYVHAMNAEYTDHGLFAISIGTEAKRAKEVTQAILFECQRLTEDLISNEELAKAKEYHLGHLYMGLETTDSLADFYAEQEVTTGRPNNPKDIEKAIRKVSSKDVQKLAQEIFQNKNLNLAIVGDIKDTKGLKKVLRF